MIDRVKRNLFVIWHQLKKGILQVFTASVVNKVVLMLCSMILTRMLTQNEYGILSYAGNVYSYANLISGFGLAAGALQFGMESRGAPEENRFYRYCASAGMLVNLLIIVSLSIGVLTAKLQIGQAKPYILAYLPLLITEYFIQLLLIILRSKSQFGLYAKMITTHTILSAGGTCIGAVWGIRGVIAAKYVSSIIVFGVLGWNSRKILGTIYYAGNLYFHQKKQLWHYSVFNGISSTLNRLLFLIDLSMVAALIASTEMLAVYKVATLIPNAITFIPQSVVICVVPDIVAHNHNKLWLKQSFRKTFAGMLAFNLVLGTGLILFAPWIIRVVAGERYIAAAAPFRVLVAGYCVAGTFRSLSVNFLAALKAVRCNVICSIILCAADVILNFLFIPRMGMIGAAYATFGTEVLSSILTFGCLMHILKNR